MAEWIKRYLDEGDALLKGEDAKAIEFFIRRVRETDSHTYNLVSTSSTKYKELEGSEKLSVIKNDLKTVLDWLRKMQDADLERLEKERSEEQERKAREEARLEMEQAEQQAKRIREQEEMERKYGTAALDQHVERCRKILGHEDGCETAEAFCNHVACVYATRIPGLTDSLSIFDPTKENDYEEDVAKLLEFLLVYRDDLTKNTVIPARQIDKNALLLALLKSLA